MKAGTTSKWMQVKNNEYIASLEAKKQEPPDMKPEDQIHVETWEEFLAELNKAFKPVDSSTNTQLKMKNLKQNKCPIDEYITDFILLTKDTKYDDKVLIDHFMAGLNPGLLSSCLSTPDQPKDIEGWYDWARKYNNMWLTKQAIPGGAKVLVEKAAKPAIKVKHLSDAQAADYCQKCLCF
ncbi:hypothetical protein Moror_14767 [Moniliophthora roreri MCA 2997]|uniref:Retrotransposon gag domain-containing protein n=2 Tax=Moniliophthora roreri TaxID=221103 RepID=V2X6G1_MONRO|nr:hypothetical protein Moror_14767 [Moniliophthora roreri MCA 2997]